MRACHQAKGIDFCHACGDFPCNNTGFNEHMHRRWIELNEHVRKVGIEKYYEQTKDQPRYR
ncbi:MAG: DUF3795 domain-containing protein [Desulfobacteraceae bacterium]|nr:DUF3795 domain-containing protein [Desulfobacteraceae bacterium]